MDAGFRKWLGESRGFQPGDTIQTREQFDALYRLYLNETASPAARQSAVDMRMQQMMEQGGASQQDSESAIGSWISSLFGGNDPGRPVSKAAPAVEQAPADARPRRSASALLSAALQDAEAPAMQAPQLPTGGRVAFEEAMPMATPTPAPTPTPTPAPTPMPQNDFVGEAFTRDEIRKLTGKDVAPGEYFDANGRPFLVK